MISGCHLIDRESLTDEASCCCSQNSFWNEPSGNVLVAFSWLSSMMVLKSEWVASPSSIPSCSMTCLMRWLTRSSRCFSWRFARCKLWRRSIFSGVESWLKLVWLLGFTLSFGDPFWYRFNMLFSNFRWVLHFSQRTLACSSRTSSQSLCRIVLNPSVSDSTDATTWVPVYKIHKQNYFQLFWPHILNMSAPEESMKWPLRMVCKTAYLLSGLPLQILAASTLFITLVTLDTINKTL